MMSNPNVEAEHDLQEHEDAAQEWRRARYEELGFSLGESIALAKARQAEYTGSGTETNPKREWSQPLDWKKVKSALDNGCTLELALQIFTE